MAAAWRRIDPCTHPAPNHPAPRIDKVAVNVRSMIWILLEDRKISGRRESCLFCPTKWECRWQVDFPRTSKPAAWTTKPGRWRCRESFAPGHFCLPPEAPVSRSIAAATSYLHDDLAPKRSWLPTIESRQQPSCPACNRRDKWFMLLQITGLRILNLLPAESIK